MTLVCVHHVVRIQPAFLVLMNDSFKFYFFLVSPQVNVAFDIVYNSGLNEYALYLDCEGDRIYHKGYERTMSHLFMNYRKRPHTHKVSVTL